MDLDGRKNNIYFDKDGKQILVGDLLQIYHCGVGKRTHYLYHVVVLENTPDFPVLAARSYLNEKPHYRMYTVCDNENRIYKAARILNEKDFKTKRLKIDITTTSN